MLMRVLTKTLLLAMFLVAAVTTAFSQERVVSGTVKTKDGLGISGATVRSSGSNRATVTDTLGNFRIGLTDADKSLNISSVGFFAKSFPVTSATAFNFILQDDPKSLTEVVVTAYGIKKEAKRIGYTVQEVKGADLTKARDANPINSLAGKVAGLTVGASSEMLGRPEIVLRGSKDLLFVVDGIPVNTDTWNIAPDDIETYTVLKGPNAAALYGFRGQNGAIIITTKRGSKDKKGWQVDVNTSTVFETGFLAEPKSQVEYGRGTNFQYSYGDQLYDNSQRLPEWGPRFEGQPVKQYNSPWDPVTRIRTATPWTAKGADNFHKFMQTGLINTNNISLATASDRSDIRISLSNMNQKGQAPNTRLNSYSLAVNAGYNITPKLRIEASVNLNKQYSPNIPDVNYGPNSYLYMFKVYGSADYDIDDLKDIYKGPQGVQDLIPYMQEYGRENSAWFIAKKWLRSHDKLDVNGYLKATYKFSNALSLSLRSQITTWNQVRTEKVPAGINLNTYTPWYYFGWYGDYREDRRNLFENNTDMILNFEKKIGKFNIAALAGGAERSFMYNSLYGTTKALAVPNVYALTNSQTPYSSFTWGSRMQVYSGFYSFDISYDKYLTLSHTGRVDNLSTLPTGRQTYYYPSVSLSSVLSDYIDFPKAISFVKVRGSFADVKGGLTQATVPSAYTQVTGLSTNGGLLGYGTDLLSSYDGPSYTNQNAYGIASYYNNTPSVSYSTNIANPNIKPFDVTSYEGGVDVKFLKNRLGLDVTYFSSTNGPGIVQLPIGASTSYSTITENAITTTKKGFEIALSGSPLRSARGLNWEVLVNYSTYKETLKDIFENEKSIVLNNHSFKKGDRMDAIYIPGFVRDASGSIIYSGGLPLRPSPSDITNNILAGYANPDFTFGINNKFSYRGWSFSFQFDGRIGGKIYDEVYHDGMNGGTSIESATGALGAARYAEWQTTSLGTVAPAKKYVAPGKMITSGTPQYANGQITNLKDLTLADNNVPVNMQTFVVSGLAPINEYWMTDRSFAKLREVTIGYSLPASMLSKSKFVKGASISLVGRNLLYFAKRKDMDNDQFASGYNASDRSLGNGGLLQSMTGRRLGFNINVSF
ncbi:MAG: SusC/RagA family TonB-linked outer membrane protein [Chitinophagaceae bacterium]